MTHSYSYPHIFTKHWLSLQFAGKNPNTIKWTSLIHNGVYFPPEYEKHNVPVIYDGAKIYLDEKAEEMATLYAKYIETDYIKNKMFNKNFWSDWQKVLGKNHIIQSLEKCNFEKIYNYILEQKEKKKGIKEDVDKFKTAIVDGKPQPVGNFRIEPPGIFLGRGCNPLIGKIKKRIYPEDIIINIGENVAVPVPMNGHKWKKIIHDNKVEWLASWTDTITGKNKYVWLAAHSELKGKSDEAKFDLARELKKKINKIRNENNNNMNSEQLNIRQVATAVYLIDKLALRVGNEKDPETEADTVGVTSLRVEHVKLLENNTLHFDFLGKDSVRYTNDAAIDKIPYENIKEFTQNKKSDDELFDLISSNDINKYLNQFMKGLTAKCIRTMASSSLFQNELDKANESMPKNLSDKEKVNFILNAYNNANAKVAMLCNHQKSIGKSFDKQIESVKTRMNELKKKLDEEIKGKNRNEKIKKYKADIKTLKAKKELKMQIKNISLGTSKNSYLDPRITIAFMKKHNVPIEKVFSATLRDKFAWSFSVDENFKF